LAADNIPPHALCQLFVPENLVPCWSTGVEWFHLPARAFYLREITHE